MRRLTVSDELENLPVEGADPEAEEDQVEETEEETDEVDNFLSDVEEEGVIPSAASVITVQTSGGDTRYVPTETSLTVKDLLSKANLLVGGTVEYWLNGSKLQSSDEIIPIGAKLVVVGSVKGGVN
jgi:hypothetical protein